MPKDIDIDKLFDETKDIQFEAFDDYPVKILVVGVGFLGNNVIKQIKDCFSSAPEPCPTSFMSNYIEALTVAEESKLLSNNGKLSLDLVTGKDLVVICVSPDKKQQIDIAVEIAKASKSQGSLTIAVLPGYSKVHNFVIANLPITLPILTLNNSKELLAAKAINDLKKESDCVVIIPQDKIKKSDNYKITDFMFKTASMIVRMADHREMLPHDFVDILHFFRNAGEAYVGIGTAKELNDGSGYCDDHVTYASVEKKSLDAAKELLSCELIDQSVNLARKTILYITVSYEMGLAGIEAIISELHQNMRNDSDYLADASLDDCLDNELEAIAIFTDFEKSNKLRRRKCRQIGST